MYFVWLTWIIVMRHYAYNNKIWSNGIFPEICVAFLSKVVYYNGKLKLMQDKAS